MPREILPQAGVWVGDVGILSSIEYRIIGDLKPGTFEHAEQAEYSDRLSES